MSTCDGGNPNTALMTRLVFADKVARREHIWSEGSSPRYCLLCCELETGGKLGVRMRARQTKEQP